MSQDPARAQAKDGWSTGRSNWTRGEAKGKNWHKQGKSESTTGKRGVKGKRNICNIDETSESDWWTQFDSTGTQDDLHFCIVERAFASACAFASAFAFAFAFALAFWICLSCLCPCCSNMFDLPARPCPFGVGPLKRLGSTSLASPIQDLRASQIDAGPAALDTRTFSQAQERDPGLWPLVLVR